VGKRHGKILKKKKKFKPIIPKLWYGWIGKNNWQLEKQF
jgi:hypothetical protein